MNKQTRRDLKSILDKVYDLASQMEELKTELEYMQEEEQSKYDNMPESLQETERGYALSESADALYDLADRLDGQISEIYDIVSEGEDLL